MGKSKYYVVWKGVKPGIYSTWDECKAQVLGFEGATYKSFESIEEAQIAFKKDSPITSVFRKSIKDTIPTKKVSQQIESNSVAVDAACSGNPGDMEYQCVKTMNKELIFHKGPFKDGTNNIGEFLALVHALALLDNKDRHDITIYTDSKTAIAWVRNKKAKTTLELTKHNKILFEMIEKAESWLKTHTIKNPIVKWETEVWGEIPADFGRK
jgi:ribonuclease HI